MTSKSTRATLVGLFLLLLITSVVSLGLGHYHLTFSEVISALFTPEQSPAIHVDVVRQIRLPRILAALCAGGALAMSGAALQGLFNNPLIGPHIIGVSSGAAFGGVLAILWGFTTLELMGVSLTTGLLTMMVVFGISRFFGNQSKLMVILAGIILAGLFSALISLIEYTADAVDVLPNILFWLMGSFSMITWEKVGFLALAVVPGSLLLWALGFRLNILSLGDQEARILGEKVVLLRWLFLGLTALLCSAQVSVSGAVGWIGLVVPHMARVLVGVDHRSLLPTSFLLGAILMVGVDDLSRTLIDAELPLGIITALLGAPIFALILYQFRQRLAS